MFRIAIIGAGRIAQVMTSAIKKSQDYEVVSIASRDYERANSFAKKNKILRAFGSYDELIQSDGYDLIYLATINSTHYEIAKKCLENYRPVLIEKPICLNLRQTEELIRISKENHVFLAEAMPLRYSSNMRDVIKAVNEGIIGDVKLLTANIGIECWETERIQSKELGGGAFYDLGVYGITLSDLVFADKPENIKSIMNIRNGVDTQCSVILSYRDSQSFCFSSTILQTKGMAVLHGDRGRIYIYKAYNGNIAIIYPGIRKLKIKRNRKSVFLEEIIACSSAINNSLIETEQYNHSDIIRVSMIMDNILKMNEIGR